VNSKIKLHFYGAAQTVTGSKFLLETPELNILIDCGMFQGLKDLRLQNWEDFPFCANEIDLVLLTHGHLDHCGYLPRLVKQGFEGAIKGTAPTLAIASVILRDSAMIQEEEAKQANEEGYSKHHPALPLYSEEDAERAIDFFQPIDTDQWVSISENIKFRFRKVGHIIGATFIELEVYGKIIVFSGDIGRKGDPLLHPPQKPEWADIIVMESTYGDRQHPQDDCDSILIEAVNQAIRENGTIIIPSFAVERLQSLMYKLWMLYSKNKIPNIPIFIDSPMGNEVLAIFNRFDAWHKLTPAEFTAMTRHFNIITSYKDTWKTIDNKRPKIVIAGSGMVTGGRVLTYLRYYLDVPQTQVLLVGFQAEGTRGRRLLEGEKEIKLQGKYIPVKAHIKTIESLSAHADQGELIDWLSEIKNIPEQLFLVHGEVQAMEVLKGEITDVFSWKVILPQLNTAFDLGFNINLK
jgi:metallo-beta-lactamase family protein